MLFRQITHDDLGCASYLIGDERAGVAAVVDPRFEIDEYLELARYRGVTIEHVLETHNHADHVSGHGRLVAATGARIHVHRLADPAYEHEPFEDGWELRLGSLTVRALHTPGHRPEHTAFLLIDTNRGGDPWAVLSGDSLFVGDVARTDLAVEQAEGARQIFRSVHERLLTLPDDCELWPAHLGGSMCGGPGMDMKICSTVGYEKQHNPTLAIADEEEFVAQALAKLGPQPPNFEKIVALNRGPLLTSGVEVPALYPHQVQLKRERGGAAGGRPHRPAVRRRPHPRLDLHSLVQLRVRLQARVARRPRSGDRVHRARRRRRATRRQAGAVGGGAQRRGPAGGRHDQLAPGTARRELRPSGWPPPTCSADSRRSPSCSCSTSVSCASGTPAMCRGRCSRRGTTSRGSLGDWIPPCRSP